MNELALGLYFSAFLACLALHRMIRQACAALPCDPHHQGVPESVGHSGSGWVNALPAQARLLALCFCSNRLDLKQKLASHQAGAG